MWIGLGIVCSCEKVPEHQKTAEMGYYVRYNVTGSARFANLTYQSGPGATQQEQHVSLPWSKFFSMHAGDPVYIAAQNSGDAGTVAVEIVAAGKIIQSATSTGAYAVATAGGVCCSQN